MTAETSDKIFMDANTLLADAFRLGEQVLAAGFRPTLLLALWRGGTPVGVAIQELLSCRGVEHEHYPLKTNHYSGIAKRRGGVDIEGLEPILAKISADTRLLIVDDVFDTGLTLDALITTLEKQSRIRPENIRIATPWFKPDNNRTDRRPDYFLHETSRWIVFPHELHGLTAEELATGKAEPGAS